MRRRSSALPVKQGKVDTRKRRSRLLLFGGALTLGLVVVVAVVQMRVPAAPETVTDSAFAEMVRATVAGMPPTEFGLPPDVAEGSRGLAYAALRAGGLRLGESWQAGGDAAEALARAIGAARASADPELVSDVDTVEISIAGPEEEARSELVPENLDRGIIGLTITVPDGRRFVRGPTEMIADNTSFERILELLVDDGTITGFERDAAEIGLFPAATLLVHLDGLTITRMVRGNQLVPPEAVTEASTRALADGMSQWLHRQVTDEGRMVYEYWPSRGEESSDNNMIRQWMATIALIRSADAGSDDGGHEQALRNIRYNLELSFSEEGELGLIADPDGDVKLGAVALAALAISQHPDRGEFAKEEAALRRMVDHLWQDDGSFTTFYRPEGRDDNQNFYPGEALLLWAWTLEHDGDDPELTRRFMKSFNYYRSWHREQRNPAFVPWHSMAYEAVWQITRDAELRDFVFEMNDWLLQMQQWDGAPSPDVAGRFYSPDRPDYGPPHASSDGVYLEGLIAAYRMAVQVQDHGRAEAYRLAISRGLRHLMQLQFTDEVDMYYVSQRDRVAGGLRTTVYDNRIRVDNVQHGYLAVLDILEPRGRTS